ncbi:MAG: DNA polymerase III subunit delta [Lachnospiraceae bacterium]|nr:DNA polymerase III subunit delta [Lachnospiraceae bacterium]
MKTIDADIKAGSFAPVYLLYGEENYLKKQYKEKLVKSLVAEGDTMNFSSFEGKDIRPEALIDLAETMPFFADRRLILVENGGMFKNACEELAEYIKNIAPSSCFVFVEEEVDKRSKMFKRVKSAGRVVEFSRQGEKVLTQWILGRIKREQKNITKDALAQFLGAVGDDMGTIHNELEKLLCYCADQDAIEASDVQAVCTNQTVNKIFDMVNAVAEKNQKKALSLYYDLLALKEPPMRILFLIARQFQILLQIKELSGKGYDQKFIASQAGIPEFAVRKNQGQARSFTSKQLIEAVTECVEMEEAVKTGNMNDRMAVELLIVSYSG